MAVYKAKITTSFYHLGYRDRDRDRYDSDWSRDGPRREMDRFGGRDRFDDRRDYDRGTVVLTGCCHASEIEWSLM